MAGLKPGFGRLASMAEAFEVLYRYVPDVGATDVALPDARGRVLASDVVSPVDVPHFRKSAMDGYAVRAADTFGASASGPRRLDVLGSVWPGEVFGGEVGHGEAVEIGTGAPLPDGADAVVMVEYTEPDAGGVAVSRALAPGDNVIEAGSDVAEGTVVLAAGTVLEPRHVGVLGALGVETVSVRERVRVSLFSTGNEILEPGRPLEPGKIHDINTWALRAALEADGCEVAGFGVVPDDRAALARVLQEAVAHGDLVVLSGGSSLGGGDLVGEVLSDLGDTLVHGVAIKPGKPVVIGAVTDPTSGRDKPVIALPGYPMSCLSDYEILVRPILDRAVGRTRREAFIEARMARKHASTIGRYEFLPVRVSGGEAHPLTKGSSAITSLTEADGFVEIAENVEVVERGEPVRVRLFT